jgi:hypothetical protein
VTGAYPHALQRHLHRADGVNPDRAIHQVDEMVIFDIARVRSPKPGRAATKAASTGNRA